MLENFYSNFLPIALSLVAYNALFMGFFVFLKKHDASGLLFLVSNLVVFGWTLGLSYLVSRALLWPQVEFWGSFSQCCFLMIPVTWLHLVVVYTRSTKKHLVELLMAYLFTLGYLIFGKSNLFILSYRSIAGFSNYPIPGPVFKGLTLMFAVIIMYAFGLLYIYWKREESEFRREDARLFFFTQLYGYGLSGLCLLPVYGWDIPQYQLLVLPFWQLVLGYAMIRHHLLDSETMVKTIHRDRLASMSTVTASMHHELKNPLTSIKTFAEFLPKKYDDADFREKFSKIVTQEVNRVNDLLVQLLEFSKPHDPKMVPISLKPLIEETVTFMRHIIEKNGITVEYHWSGDVKMMADRHQMKQVILNLVTNAVQAMPEGGLLQIVAGLDKKNKGIIQITDTGVGMSPEQLRQIRDPFYTTKEKGSGLGLSIVEQILEKHEAFLDIGSQEGKGTTIQITLKKIVKGG